MKKILVVGLVGYSLFYELDHNPQIGESVITKSITKEIGAKAFNEAYTIKKLGGNVKFISSIGDDEFKDLIYTDLKKVGLSDNIVLKHGPNTIASIMTCNGKNSVFVSKGVELDNNDLDYIYKEIEECDIVLLTNEIDEGILNKIIDKARLLNKYIILNVSPVKEKNYIDFVNMIVLNEIEHSQFLASLEIEEILDIYCESVITNGDKPIIYLSSIDGGVHSIDVPQVDNVVDTTGAGDIFLGALTYMLSKIDDISKIDVEKIRASIIFAASIAGNSVKYKYVLESIKQSTK